MKVYLVMYMDHSGFDEIYEIYSTREKAEEIQTKIINQEIDLECISAFVIEREVK